MNLFKKAMGLMCILSVELPLCAGGPLCLPRPAIKIPIESLRTMSTTRFVALQKQAVAWDVQIGMLSVRVPVEMQQKYPLVLREATQKARLSAHYFPSTALANDAKIAQNLMRLTEHTARFEQQKNVILSNLQSNVFQGKIPYKNFLPASKDIDYLYIGEVHDKPRVQQEIISLITQLPAIYPDRNIYVATEFLPEEPFSEVSIESCALDRTLPLHIISSQKQLSKLLKEEYLVSNDLRAILDAGMPLVGLEPQLRIVDKLYQETRHIKQQIVEDAINEWYGRFSVSEEGMAYRNKIWAQHLAQLRAKDPSALIVVYAGAAHVGYQSDFSVPWLIPQQKQFVVFVTPSDYVRYLNPLFDGLQEEPALQEDFRKNANAKMVTFWKQKTPLKKIMGADLSVIVHKK